MEGHDILAVAVVAAFFLLWVFVLPRLGVRG